MAPLLVSAGRHDSSISPLHFNSQGSHPVSRSPSPAASSVQIRQRPHQAGVRNAEAMKPKSDAIDRPNPLLTQPRPAASQPALPMSPSRSSSPSWKPTAQTRTRRPLQETPSASKKTNHHELSSFDELVQVSAPLSVRSREDAHTFRMLEEALDSMGSHNENMMRKDLVRADPDRTGTLPASRLQQILRAHPGLGECNDESLARLFKRCSTGTHGAANVQYTYMLDAMLRQPTPLGDSRSAAVQPDTATESISKRPMHRNAWPSHTLLGDGDTAVAHAAALINDKLRARNSHVLIACRRNDSDRSGLLSADKFADALQSRIGSTLPVESIRQYAQHCADPDNDGLVPYEDIVTQAMYQPSAQPKVPQLQKKKNPYNRISQKVKEHATPTTTAGQDGSDAADADGCHLLDSEAARVAARPLLQQVGQIFERAPNRTRRVLRSMDYDRDGRLNPEEVSRSLQMLFQDDSDANNGRDDALEALVSSAADDRASATVPISSVLRLAQEETGAVASAENEWIHRQPRMPASRADSLSRRLVQSETRAGTPSPAPEDRPPTSVDTASPWYASEHERFSRQMLTSRARSSAASSAALSKSGIHRLQSSLTPNEGGLMPLS